jgi:hypothetical protein
MGRVRSNWCTRAIPRREARRVSMRGTSGERGVWCCRSGWCEVNALSVLVHRVTEAGALSIMASRRVVDPIQAAKAPSWLIGCACSDRVASSGQIAPTSF